jgi:hypothetical protein
MHFDIRKQKIVWIFKYREWGEEATGNALKKECRFQKNKHY